MLRDLMRRLFPPAPTLDDPVFGRLRFQATPDPARSYWEGTATFAPVGGEVEVFVDAGIEGPGERQRLLYRSIEARYAELRAALAPLLERAYREWIEREPPADVWSAFTLGAVAVPRSEAPGMEWELVYDCRDDEDHTFTASMRDWRPDSEIRIDG